MRNTNLQKANSHSILSSLKIQQTQNKEVESGQHFEEPFSEKTCRLNEQKKGCFQLCCLRSEMSTLKA